MDFIDFPAFLVILETQTYFSKTLTMSDLTIFLSESFLIMILAKFLTVWIFAVSFAVVAGEEAELEDGEDTAWTPTSILRFNESALLNVNLSVLQFAAMLHQFDLELNHGGVKINPQLLKSARVARTKEQLRMGIHAFASAVQPLIPDYVKSESGHTRSKRSILGWIATTSDLDSMTAVIENLKGKENQILNFENNLVQKVNSVTEQMSKFIHAGEMNIESISRSLLHVQSEIIVTAWTQACRDAIRELQHLTTAVLTGWAPLGLFHQLERGKLLAANLTQDNFHLTFYLERFYAAKAECRQLKSAPVPVCRIPGPSFFRPGIFRDAYVIGVETILFSDEQHAISEKSLGEAPKCRVKQIGPFEIPYFCWGRFGSSGKPTSPLVSSTSWYAESLDDFDLDTAELVRTELDNKIWKKMGTSGISHFVLKGAGGTTLPPWSLILISSLASFVIGAACVGFVYMRTQKKALEMQNVIGELRAEHNDLRGIVLTARTRTTECQESFRAELDEIRSRFRR